MDPLLLKTKCPVIPPTEKLNKSGSVSILSFNALIKELSDCSSVHVDVLGSDEFAKFSIEEQLLLYNHPLRGSVLVLTRLKSSGSPLTSLEIWPPTSTDQPTP